MANSILITGGAGFIGANLAERALGRGQRVRILDNLSRSGARENLRELERQHGGSLEVIRGDVREPRDVRRALAGTSAVIHCAAQVAVTTSLCEPLDDFEINARGTLNLLEELRQAPRPLVFTSTNKVYGDLSDIPLTRDGDRYLPADPALRRGIDETRPLAFCSPYGCSKGAADQYVLDYARTYGVPATVFRMSCIYGPRQFGTEDQGWVAHFLLSALSQRPITIYGDGHQVRDLLFIGDLADAVFRALACIDATAGRAFNIGGGPDRLASPREILALIGELTGRTPEVHYADWRSRDQRYYVSNSAAFQQITGWQPRVEIRDGLAGLCSWLDPVVGQAGLCSAASASSHASSHASRQPPMTAKFHQGSSFKS